MRQVHLKDNSHYNNDDLNSIPQIRQAVFDKTMEQLELEGVLLFPESWKDSSDISKKDLVIEKVNSTCFKTTNVMGFLGMGDERMVITSRFGGRDKDFFFRYLMEKVLDAPNLLNMKMNGSDKDSFFDFLAFLFPYYLRSALRKGLFKTYVTHEMNDANVRGVINLSKHIKTNTPFLGRVAYTKRDFSYDNSLISLIRHTIEYIKNRSYGHQVLGHVREEVRTVVQATPTYMSKDRPHIIALNKRNPIHHAYYKEYFSLQKICLLILNHEKDYFGLNDRKMYGVLIDGSWLWEEYIHLLISEFYYHPQNKKKQGGQRLFTGNIGPIYPDFISIERQQRVIADAKYKPIENIGNKDYLQMLAYMFRFESQTGYYFYPEIEDRPPMTHWMNRGTSYESNVAARDDVNVTKYGLKIPRDVADYEQFVYEMVRAEKAFVRGVTKI